MRRTAAPVIGVSGPDRGGLAAWLFTALAVRAKGGRPRRIRPRKPIEGAELDGLIIGGGADVDPQRYGGARLVDALGARYEFSLGERLLYPLIYLLRKVLSTKRPLGADRARDAVEARLLESAHERRMPVLGICRGAQLINVHFGGTLHQDLGEFYEESPQIRSVLPRKRIRIEAGTRLAGALAGVGDCYVNSLHRQAIDTPGTELRVSATEANGVIQGIEHRHDPFTLGVQWHPEYLFPLRRSQRRLFGAVVESARRYRSEKKISGLCGRETAS